MFCSLVGPLKFSHMFNCAAFIARNRQKEEKEDMMEAVLLGGAPQSSGFCSAELKLTDIISNSLTCVDG